MNNEGLIRILLGGAEVEAHGNEEARKIYGAKFNFYITPEEIVARAKTGNYDVALIDINFNERDYKLPVEEKVGFKVFESLRNLPLRKILWTGTQAYTEGVNGEILISKSDREAGRYKCLGEVARGFAEKLKPLGVELVSKKEGIANYLVGVKNDFRKHD